jgi:pimeloyl-ACP methyl ester carboxylesterase
MASIERFLRVMLGKVGCIYLMALAMIALAPSTIYAETTPRLRPFPGVRVDIGTHRMHIFCQGKGSPAVIMDSGLGGSSLEWIRIQRSLARRVQVCIYDRAGYGWSEPGPAPRTSSRIANELFVLLKQARLTGPYVLVGHSFGGYNIQVFASRYPYTTAGLVLVDSSHPDQVERLLQPPIRLNTAPSGKGKTVMFSSPKLPRNLPEEAQQVVLSLLQFSGTKWAMADEYLNFRQSASEVKEAGALPKVPMAVLTRGVRASPPTPRGDLIEQLWFELQIELAERSPHAVHIVANRSGHHIHLDQPQLVSEAISLVVDVARQSYLALKGSPEVAKTLGPTWFAFRDATWHSDRLNTKLHLGPLERGRLSQNGFLTTGRIAGPIKTSFQPVEYIQGIDSFH